MAGLGTTQRATYLKIKNGAIVMTIKPTQKEEFAGFIRTAAYVTDYKNKAGNECTDICWNYFEMAKLVGIKLRESEYNGMKTLEWQVISIDDEGERYIVSFGYDSGDFQGFINSLCAINGPIGTLKFTPYMKKDKDGVDRSRVSIRHNGEKTDWKFSLDEIPKLEQVFDSSGQPYKDPKTQKNVYDSKKRMAFFTDLVGVINKKLGYDPTREVAPAEQQPMAQPQYAQASAPVYNAPVNNNGYANKPANGAAPQQQPGYADVPYNNYEDVPPPPVWN